MTTLTKADVAEAALTMAIKAFEEWAAEADAGGQAHEYYTAEAMHARCASTSLNQTAKHLVGIRRHVGWMLAYQANPRTLFNSR